MSSEEQNIITKIIPEEAKIADELQIMKENTGSSSIIRWTLENKAKELSEWCYLDDNGELKGELATRFAQAIRLEGTKSAQSKHAAGVVIAPQPLNELCPLVYDSKNKTTIAGMEMGDLEDMGLIKLDILGVAALDKLMGVSDILRYGDIQNKNVDEFEHKPLKAKVF